MAKGERKGKAIVNPLDRLELLRKAGERSDFDKHMITILMLSGMHVSILGRFTGKNMGSDGEVLHWRRTKTGKEAILVLQDVPAPYQGQLRKSVAWWLKNGRILSNQQYWNRVKAVDSRYKPADFRHTFCYVALYEWKWSEAMVKKAMRCSDSLIRDVYSEHDDREYLEARGLEKDW